MLGDEFLQEAERLMSDPDWLKQAELEFEQMKADAQQQADPPQTGGASRGFYAAAASLTAVVMAMAFA